MTGDDMPFRNLKDLLAAMAIVDPSREYYAITMTVDESGKCFIDTQTHWAGWSDADRLTEVRVPSIVKPEAMIRYWEIVEQPYVVVNDESQWFVYFQIGGNALVEKAIAETYLARTFRTMQSEPTIQIAGPGSGFVALDLLPKHTTQRAPTPRLRMEVFKRDNRRCRICGSCPANNVHVELHVHHIRPWERGGHTHIENLITLCHTCHRGLDPHEDTSLFELLPRLKLGQDHAAGVLRYRERLKAKLAEFEAPQKRTKRNITRQGKRC
ncbi:MAG: HNH endonuclease [Bryobacteraceae bacterium]|jgi:hypothetical protein